MNEDERHMRRALELAARGLGRTSPNPAVGAVVVREGLVVGEGYHRQAGTPHAEVHALRRAGEQARGADLYVTLEPCSHHGRTPPCVDAILASGVRRVVVATQDPNPRVCGRGIARLRDAGLQVEVGLLEREAARLNEFFFTYVTRQRPFVALKTAMTLDGKIATGSGDSRWITGVPARQRVHRLRDVYDAILVGAGTVIKDDPLLNTRLDEPGTRDPVRVILDSWLDIPAESRVVTTARRQRTIVVCARGADASRAQRLARAGVEVLELEAEEGLVPPARIMEALAARELTSVLVEGGAQVNAGLLEAGLVDKVFWFIAPRIFGGERAPSPVGGSGVQRACEAVALREVEIERIGEDLLVTGYL